MVVIKLAARIVDVAVAMVAEVGVEVVLKEGDKKEEWVWSF